MFSQEIEPVDVDLIRIYTGEDDLWNGFFVRDHLYPTADEFSIHQYRELVSRVRRVRIQATKLAHNVVEVFETAGSDEIAENPDSASKPYQHTSPEFQ